MHIHSSVYVPFLYFLKSIITIAIHILLYILSLLVFLLP